MSERGYSRAGVESGSGGTRENKRRNKRTRGTHVLESASGGKVRIQKESEHVSSTHPLESALGKTSEDTEEERASEGHTHPE